MKNSYKNLESFSLTKRKWSTYSIANYFQGVLPFVLLDNYINSEVIGPIACMSFQLKHAQFSLSKIKQLAHWSDRIDSLFFWKNWLRFLWFYSNNMTRKKKKYSHSTPILPTNHSSTFHKHKHQTSPYAWDLGCFVDWIILYCDWYWNQGCHVKKSCL